MVNKGKNTASCFSKISIPPAKAAAIHFARLAVHAGAYGVVCSPKEVAVLREQPELSHLKLFVPAIRRKTDKAGDQKRVDDPTTTIKAGADYLVIGSPIFEDADPVAAFDSFAKEINDAVWDLAAERVSQRS